METKFIFSATKQRGKETTEKLWAVLTPCGFLSMSSYAQRLESKT